jgi:hypothetical protein
MPSLVISSDVMKEAEVKDQIELAVSEWGRFVHIGAQR